MTPKEKAESLFNKYYQYDITIIGVDSKLEERGICLYDAKQLAIIAVDELIESHLVLTTTHDIKPSIRCKRYWEEVKTEIEKL
jgi:hypothetical protein